MAKFQIYGTPTSPPTRVARVAAIEYGHEFELCQMAWRVTPDELFKLNPAGRVPALVHGDMTLYDSRQIWAYIEQLEDSQPSKGLRRSDGPNRWREANAATLAYEALGGMMTVRGMAEEPPIEEHPYLDRSKARIHQCLSALDAMAEQGWLVEPGTFGLADAVTVCATDAMAGRETIDMKDYPHLEGIRMRYGSRKSLAETFGDYFPGQRGGVN
jgi:glutathione S-transferase